MMFYKNVKFIYFFKTILYDKGVKAKEFLSRCPIFDVRMLNRLSTILLLITLSFNSSLIISEWEETDVYTPRGELVADFKSLLEIVDNDSGESRESRQKRHQDDLETFNIIDSTDQYTAAEFFPIPIPSDLYLDISSPYDDNFSITIYQAIFLPPPEPLNFPC